MRSWIYYLWIYIFLYDTDSFDLTKGVTKMRGFLLFKVTLNLLLKLRWHFGIITWIISFRNAGTDYELFYMPYFSCNTSRNKTNSVINVISYISGFYKLNIVENLLIYCIIGYQTMDMVASAIKNNNYL